MEQRLEDKVAIVTGAGQGIGKGIAMRLALEGADVVVVEQDATTAAATAKEIGRPGRAAAAYPVDVADVASVRQMVDDVVSRFGHIEILVNNAGVIKTQPMLEITESDWDRVISVNQRGLFFCLQLVAQQMVRQVPDELKASQPADVLNLEKSPVRRTSEGAAKGAHRSFGKIVNLSSISGRRGRPLQTHYAASKAAVISITQSAALALASYNINVNAICPGIVPTPMWEGIDQDRGRLFGAKPGQAMAAFIDSVPLRRASTPEDIAGAVAFLCSRDADYITGQTLNVDGGYEMD